MVLSINYTHPKAKYLLAKSLESRGRHVEAFRLFKQVLKAVPEDVLVKKAIVRLSGQISAADRESKNLSTRMGSGYFRK